MAKNYQMQGKKKDGTIEVLHPETNSGNVLHNEQKLSYFLSNDGYVNKAKKADQAINAEKASVADNSTKLDGKDSSYYLNYYNFFNTPTIPTKATTSTYGTVKMYTSSIQKNAVSSYGNMAGRTYPIQFDSNGRLVVNVPWQMTPSVYDELVINSYIEYTGLEIREEGYDEIDFYFNAYADEVLKLPPLEFAVVSDFSIFDAQEESISEFIVTIDITWSDLWNDGNETSTFEIDLAVNNFMIVTIGTEIWLMVDGELEEKLLDRSFVGDRLTICIKPSSYSRFDFTDLHDDAYISLDYVRFKSLIEKYLL